MTIIRFNVQNVYYSRYSFERWCCGMMRTKHWQKMLRIVRSERLLFMDCAVYMKWKMEGGCYYENVNWWGVNVNEKVLKRIKRNEVLMNVDKKKRKEEREMEKKKKGKKRSDYDERRKIRRKIALERKRREKRMMETREERNIRRKMTKRRNKERMMNEKDVRFTSYSNDDVRELELLYKCRLSSKLGGVREYKRLSREGMISDKDRNNLVIMLRNDMIRLKKMKCIYVYYTDYDNNDMVKMKNSIYDKFVDKYEMRVIDIHNKLGKEYVKYRFKRKRIKDRIFRDLYDEENLYDENNYFNDCIINKIDKESRSMMDCINDFDENVSEKNEVKYVDSDYISEISDISDEISEYYVRNVDIEVYVNGTIMRYVNKESGEVLKMFKVFVRDGRLDRVRLLVDEHNRYISKSYMGKMKGNERKKYRVKVRRKKTENEIEKEMRGKLRRVIDRRESRRMWKEVRIREKMDERENEKIRRKKEIIKKKRRMRRGKDRYYEDSSDSSDSSDSCDNIDYEYEIENEMRKFGRSRLLKMREMKKLRDEVSKKVWKK